MRDGQLHHHIRKQQSGEGSLACVFLVVHRQVVCGYSWEAVEIPLWPCLLCAGNAYSVRECKHHDPLRLLGCGWVVCMYCHLESVWTLVR